MTSDIKRIWVTSHALTAGIIEVPEAEIGFDDAMASWRIPNGYRMHAHGNNFHLTREAAVKRAEEMRVKKIASLKKSIAKLEKLSFGG